MYSNIALSLSGTASELDRVWGEELAGVISGSSSLSTILHGVDGFILERKEADKYSNLSTIVRLNDRNRLQEKLTKSKYMARCRLYVIFLTGCRVAPVNTMDQPILENVALSHSSIAPGPVYAMVSFDLSQSHDVKT
jgi:hypothetical protein